MKNFCEKAFYPTFNFVCCIKHLIDLESYASMQMNEDSYIRIFIKYLPDIVNYSKNVFDEDKKDTIGQLLTIANKYVTKLFFTQANDRAKFIFKAILDIASSESETFENNEIKASLYSNIACIYQSEGKYDKAMRLLDSAYKIAENEFSLIVIQNNLANVYFKLQQTDVGRETTLVIYFLCLDLHKKEIIEEDDAECFCYIIFNCCCILDNFYAHGHAICKSLLKQSHYITQKFYLKVNKVFYYPKEIIQVDQNFLSKKFTNLKKKATFKLDESRKEDTKKNKHFQLSSAVSGPILYNAETLMQGLNQILNKLDQLSIKDSTSASNPTEHQSEANENRQSLPVRLIRNSKPRGSLKDTGYIKSFAESLKKNGSFPNLNFTANKNTYTITEKEINHLTAQFDEEDKHQKKSARTPSQRQPRVSILSNGTENRPANFERPRKSLKTVINKAFEAKFTPKQNSKLGQLFSNMINNSTEMFGAKLDGSNMANSVSMINGESDNKSVSDKNPSNKSSRNTIRGPEIPEDSSLNFEPKALKKESKDTPYTKTYYSIIEDYLAKECSGMGIEINIEGCDEPNLEEAKTFYSKSIKSNVKQTALKFFAYFLNNNLGMKQLERPALVSRRTLREKENSNQQCLKCIEKVKAESKPFDYPIKNFGHFVKALFQNFSFSANSHSKFRLVRLLNDRLSEIITSYDSEEKSLCIELNLPEEKKKMSRKITFKKLLDMILKNNFNYIQAIPDYLNYNKYRTVGDLIENFIVYHIFTTVKQGKETIGVSPDLVGNTRLRIDKFMNSKSLLVDVFASTKKSGRLLISDFEHSPMSLNIDMILDSSSFEALFELTDTKGLTDKTMQCKTEIAYCKVVRQESLSNSSTNLIGKLLNQVKLAFSKYYKKNFNKDLPDFHSICGQFSKIPISIKIEKNWTKVFIQFIRRTDSFTSNLHLDGCSFDSSEKLPNQVYYQDPFNIFLSKLIITEKDFFNIFNISLSSYDSMSEREKYVVMSSLKFAVNNNFIEKKEEKFCNAMLGIKVHKFEHFLFHEDCGYLLTFTTKLISEASDFLISILNLQLLFTKENVQSRNESNKNANSSSLTSFYKIFVGFLQASEGGDTNLYISKNFNWKNLNFLKKVKMAGIELIHNPYEDKVDDINNFLQ